MSDLDVILMDRESDRLADRDDAIENAATRLYFDAFEDLARTGHLLDDAQDYALDDAVWAGHAGGIDARAISKLVGEYHRVNSLDLPARVRADAAIGRCIREVYERHVLAITDTAAQKACA